MAKGNAMFLIKPITLSDARSGDAADVPTANRVQREFLEKLRAGDAEAFDLLVTNYTESVFALLVRLTGDPAESADLTQETFLRALRAFGDFRGNADIKTWLFRIAINQTRNSFRWWRSRKRDRTSSIHDPAGPSGISIGDLLPAGGESPEQAAIRREQNDALRTALRALKPSHREAIILCDVEGFTYEEIAYLVGVNIGTVKSRIARGRREMRKLLKDI
jgi:RNA polymerase sigma-70 factor (ECF subfamily)